MNLIKLIGLVIGNEAKDAAGWVKDNLTLSERLLYVSVIVPGLLMATGVVVGFYAYEHEIAAGLTAAKGCMLAAGILYGLLSTLFWIRATILIHLVSLATKGLNKFTDKVEVLSTETAEKFVRWLRGITAWLTAACLYAAVIPFWRSLTATAVSVICLIFFSAVYSSHWFEGPRLRKFTVSAAAIIFVIATLAMVNPRFAAAFGQLADSSADQLTDISERRDLLGQVSAQADKAATEIDQQLLLKLGERRNAILKRAVELCDGRFCSEAESADYGKLEADMEKVRNGSYWKDLTGPTESATGTFRQSDGSVGSIVDLSPPPPAARQATKAKHQPAAPDEDVFQELSKYPDL
ncbi:MAG: hypothetical protein WCT10_04385 [Patescibacteria group bacterium]|jgi:hypothetical protein